MLSFEETHPFSQLTYANEESVTAALALNEVLRRYNDCEQAFLCYPTLVSQQWEDGEREPTDVIVLPVYTRKDLIVDFQPSRAPIPEGLWRPAVAVAAMEMPELFRSGVGR